MKKEATYDCCGAEVRISVIQFHSDLPVLMREPYDLLSGGSIEVALNDWLLVEIRLEDA
jgi:hypothetical protein